MALHDIDLIIFDCDGTLTDTEELNNRALIDVLAQAGFEGYDYAYACKHWVGKTVATIALAIQMETGRQVPSTLARDYVLRVAELQKTSLKLVDGAEDLVREAAKRHKVCVASNGERQNVLSSLEQTGLLPMITSEFVFTKAQVKNPKPYPDLFLYSAAQFGVLPERCLVVEDSVAGVMAGVAAGMVTWGFSGSAPNPKEHESLLMKTGAGRVFSSLIHICDEITN